MTLNPRSVRVRMTLWFGAALALIILVFSLGIYSFVQARLLNQLNRELGRDLAAVRQVLKEDPEEVSEIEDYGVGMAYVAEGDQPVFQTEGWQHAGLSKALKRGDGAVERKKSPKKKPARADEKSRDAREQLQKNVANEKGSGKTEETVKTKPASRERENHDADDENELKAGHPWSWTSREGRSYRIMTAKGTISGHVFQVAVAQDEKPVRRTLKTLALILAIGFPGALCLAMVGGYFLAGRLLAPVGAMASKAREITAERLSERLPVANPDDEFGRLAGVFNSTLSRLEDSFERLRRFTADASHELRTPLTAIRSVGEVALQNVLDPAACRDAIGSMLEEADRLARLADSLLILTRADSGPARLNREAVDLAALVNDVTDCLAVLAEEKGQSLTVEIVDTLTVEADRTTLRQALINLLDNAIKYTPTGGHIRVAVKRIEDKAAIEVCDSGPGIPAEHREKIFERFYRVGKDRSSETGGAGLGLAIARWAVGINGGRIELESEEGRGSTFRVILTACKGGDAHASVG
jgi:heavy metal sensor kinase